MLSIPETPGGQVLAMVEQPGEASELLTVPQPRSACRDGCLQNPRSARPLQRRPLTPPPPKTDEAATPPAVAAVTAADGARQAGAGSSARAD